MWSWTNFIIAAALRFASCGKYDVFTIDWMWNAKNYSFPSAKNVTPPAELKSNLASMPIANIDSFLWNAWINLLHIYQFIMLMRWECKTHCKTVCSRNWLENVDFSLSKLIWNFHIILPTQKTGLRSQNTAINLFFNFHSRRKAYEIKERHENRITCAAFYFATLTIKFYLLHFMATS